MADANENLKSMRRFLLKAATDDDFRRTLETSPRDDVQSLLRDEYGFDQEIPETRLIPSKALCKELFFVASYLEEYANAAIADALFIPIFMVVGHAMPLAVTAEEEEVVAAG